MGLACTPPPVDFKLASEAARSWVRDSLDGEQEKASKRWSRAADQEGRNQSNFLANFELGETADHRVDIVAVEEVSGWERNFGCLKGIRVHVQRDDDKKGYLTVFVALSQDAPNGVALYGVNRDGFPSFEIPTRNRAFLTDAELEDYEAMNVDQIREILTSHNSYFRQPVQDVDGQTFDPSLVIRDAAAKYRINPKVILATLQKESTGVTRSERPSDVTMRELTGCGVSTAREQLICAAQRFRIYQDDLVRRGATISNWQVGVIKKTQDGVKVIPATQAVAGQFTYTLYAGAKWGGNQLRVGGVYLFYEAWTKLDWPKSGEQAPSQPLEPSEPTSDCDVKCQEIINRQVTLIDGRTVSVRNLDGHTSVNGLDNPGRDGKPGQTPLIAPITSTPGNRQPAITAAVINQFGVESNSRYVPDPRWVDKNGDPYTYCNTFAGDVMRAMGIPLPTKEEYLKIKGDHATVGAADLYRWLTKDSANSGWIHVDPSRPEDLRRLVNHVNAGKPALAADAGHVAVIRPGQPAITQVGELHIAQAGANNKNDLSLKELSFTPDFYIHD